MKIAQKGFSTLLTLAIIALALGGAGLYFYYSQTGSLPFIEPGMIDMGPPPSESEYVSREGEPTFVPDDTLSKLLPPGYDFSSQIQDPTAPEKFVVITRHASEDQGLQNLVYAYNPTQQSLAYVTSFADKGQVAAVAILGADETKIVLLLRESPRNVCARGWSAAPGAIYALDLQDPRAGLQPYTVSQERFDQDSASYDTCVKEYGA